ncbi:MAG: hypothetical protein J3Q66DRAFT_359316 [Benniella sp.]|nr:MAG: hypothetical protein J3Q66DRAFT_359316 [Benniella sp.]
MLLFHLGCPAFLSCVVVLSPCPFLLHVLRCPPVVLAIVSCKEKCEKECNLEPSSSREFTPCSYRQQYQTHPPLMVNQE